MGVVGYGALTIAVALIMAFGVFLAGIALGDNYGGGHRKNNASIVFGILIGVVVLITLAGTLEANSLYGSIGHAANDSLDEGRYYVVSSAEWDEDTLALVLVGLKDDMSFNNFLSERPRFHLVEQDCFRGPSVPQAGDRFEVVKTKNARFCEITSTSGP